MYDLAEQRQEPGRRAMDSVIYALTGSRRKHVPYDDSESFDAAGPQLRACTPHRNEWLDQDFSPCMLFSPSGSSKACQEVDAHQTKLQAKL